MTNANTIFVRLNQVEKIARREYVTEASTIGLKPGEWPTYVRLESFGVFFQKALEDFSNGDLIGVQYVENISGSVLDIMND